SRPPARARAAIPPDDAARGREIATAGVPARDIPACLDCHGEAPGGTPRNPAYPWLAGQPADYLALQLQLFRERRRGGSEFVHLMHSFVDRLEPSDIDDVSAFFAALPPGGAP